jgi:hypothetical protein
MERAENRRREEPLRGCWTNSTVKLFSQIGEELGIEVKVLNKEGEVYTVHLRGSRGVEVNQRVPANCSFIEINDPNGLREFWTRVEQSGVTNSSPG